MDIAITLNYVSKYPYPNKTHQGLHCRTMYEAQQTMHTPNPVKRSCDITSILPTPNFLYEQRRPCHQGLGVTCTSSIIHISLSDSVFPSP